jgi:predicted amidohydrolase YtcJ
MLPSFVDSRGHTCLVGLQATTANLFPPPDGTGKDIASLVMLLRDWRNHNKAVVEKVGWIVGFGYEDSQLADGRHPTQTAIPSCVRLHRPLVQTRYANCCR